MRLTSMFRRKVLPSRIPKKLGETQTAPPLRLLLCREDYLRAVKIAQVHGHAAGGGVGSISACDLRVAADDVRRSLSRSSISASR